MGETKRPLAYQQHHTHTTHKILFPKQLPGPREQSLSTRCGSLLLSGLTLVRAPRLATRPENHDRGCGPSDREGVWVRGQERSPRGAP